MPQGSPAAAGQPVGCRIKRPCRFSISFIQWKQRIFKGFFALCPGLMAVGSGQVKFEHFEYRTFQGKMEINTARE